MDLKVASPTQSSIDSTDYNKNQRCEPSRRNSEKIRLKPEVAVFRTTVLMIVAFSLTIREYRTMVFDETENQIFTTSFPSFYSSGDRRTDVVLQRIL